MPDYSTSPSLEPLRIGLISTHTSPLARPGGDKIGGMNVYVREVAREMGRRGLAVDVFTRAAEPSEIGQIAEIAPHARLIYLPAGPPESIPPDDVYLHLHEFYTGMFNFRRDHDLHYDALYSHYWLSGWVALQLRRDWGTPFAQMFHTLGRMKNRIAERPTTHEDIRVRGETEIINKADRIIAATPAERAQLLLLYRADRRKIDVIPPGVDLAHFKPGDRQAARAALGWPDGRKELLFVGRIEALKGIDSILEGFAHLHRIAPEVAAQAGLSIIGGDLNQPNEELKRLLVLRQMLELDERVRFIPAQGQEALLNYYRAAEALVMPSDYESFGMVALEAMACGTPVIASEVGGLAFLVKHGQTGLHIPTRDSVALGERMCHILSNSEYQQRLGGAAAIDAKNYSWARVVDQLLTAFTMLGSPPRRFRLS